MGLAEIERARRSRSEDVQKSTEALTLFTQPASGAIEMLKTGKLADFIMNCEGKSFHVHQSHLYASSNYFRSVIDGSFKESFSKSIELKDTNTIAVGMLLLLIYAGQTGQYLDNVYRIWPELRPTTTLVLAVNEANRKQYLEDHFLLEIKTMIDVYVLADKLLIHHIPAPAAKYVLWYIENFYADVPSINNPPPEQFADILEHVYLSLPETHLPLRKETTLLCLIHEARDSVNAVVKVIEKHDGYAWSLGKGFAQYHRDKDICERCYSPRQF